MESNNSRPVPKPGEIYRHFKGNKYKVIAIAVKEDTMEKLVIYQALYGEYGIWARELDVFMGEIDKEKYPGAEGRYRFELDTSTAALKVSGADAMGAAARGSGVSETIDSGSNIPGAIVSEEGGYDDKAPCKEHGLDPMLEDFLDADTIDDKLMILRRMRDIITDGMIDTMAVAMGIEVEDGPVEERYDDLLGCLRTISRYEFDGSRLR